MNASRGRRPHQVLSTLTLFTALGVTAASSLHAQTVIPVRDGSLANADPYVYAAADFGIDAASVTYHEDIAPILAENCVKCHNEAGMAPMALTTYQQARRYSQRIKERTGIRDRRGAMPPFFVERGFGIQEFRDSEYLTDEELAKIQAWVDNGAPEGDPADAPARPALAWGEGSESRAADGGAVPWELGEPDLIVRMDPIEMPVTGPDQWGDFGVLETGLTEDRFVRAVQVREVSDLSFDDPALANTVGGRFVFHHMNYAVRVLDETGEMTDERISYPIHEVGRNADIFPEEVGYPLPANSVVHMHNGHMRPNQVRETTAYLEFGFYFHPQDYQPKYRRGGSLAMGNDIDVYARPGEARQTFETFTVLDEHTKLYAWEPHLHAPGARSCLEAIWGPVIHTINCVGYDHNWVKQYLYAPGHEPLLPKGTVVRYVGYLDTTDENHNVADNRNWQGSGRRSVANMFLELGWVARLTEEEFQAEMAERRAQMKDRNDFDVGCPLCWAFVEEDFSSPPVTEQGDLDR
jgi:mono/diheme cytochrome c family protein